ncbi:LuxR C-terminal-related transcriptional regulator [Thalassovita sp.]|uniref:LuxR C-terminal-related transcriptional regulator n=1 Tax=Thalassovita sp. TaxID=1979401 RepID=UPI0029DE6624|nr:LuxR C-terminal-related transcriptional regulator [Thalassovita sp.]
MSERQQGQTDLKLKISSPRFAREPLFRERLSIETSGFAALPAVVVTAPGGYGKTSLLAQWRREFLARGTIVAWYSVGTKESPQQLLQGLVLSFREAALRPTFGHAIAESVSSGELEAFAVFLAEIANAAVETVLIIDDAEKLDDASKQALIYMLHNLPGNLRVFIGARSLDGLGIEELAAYGQCEILTAQHLTFELEETYELFRQRFSDQFDVDGVAQIHQMAQGWPLGIQLAVAAQMRSKSPLMASQMSVTNGENWQGSFVSLLLARLDDQDLDLLIRISMLEEFTTDLCAAISGRSGVKERLDAIIRSTPVIQLSEHSDWMRLHTLARTELQRRFSTLPRDEQAQLHERAANWLDAQGMPYRATRHAFAAGNTEWALDLAERSLYQAMMNTGHLGQLQGWAGVLPDAELDKRPQLLLTEAWALALSEKHGEASKLVVRIKALNTVDDTLRCECDMILGGAAVMADDPDLFAQLHEPWALNPPLTSPLLQRIHANRFAYLALLNGEPALARIRQQRAPVSAVGQQFAYLSRWRDFIIGLSYLWEGQVRLAARIIAPALMQSEADLGRRDYASVSLAAVMAAAVWESGKAEEAKLLLADRLDVLERKGAPETLMLGYRTLGRIAIAQNDEARALDLMGALDAIGTVRGLPRLNIVSLSEQIRYHAHGFRAQTCQDLLARLEVLVASDEMPKGKLWQRSVAPHIELARGLAAIAARDWLAARLPLERANTIARSAKQGRLVVETTGLLALVQRETGENAQSLATEAMELAQLFGLKRVFADAHPSLAAWLDGMEPPKWGQPVPPLSTPPKNEIPADAPAGTVQRSSALTPREWDVLEHLSRHLSNKEIARSLDVNEATVKWHVKNLFAKLDAGSRKQVVSRARLMGFLT